VRRAAVIRAIKMAAKAHELFFTEHAVQAMLDDDENEESVSNAIAHASSFTCQPDGTWRVHGDGVTAIVAIRPGVIVVTIFV
jgi:hypothetical protein